MLPFINNELRELQRQGLIRKLRRVSAVNGARVRIDGRWYVSFCTNDYLGLAQHPVLQQAAIKATREFGVGSGASRLLAGTLTPHEELEQAMARFKHSPAALLFASGYMANLGVITTLVHKDDLIFCDELNHASLIDATRLTKAKLYVYRHRDAAHLEERLAKSKRSRRDAEASFGMPSAQKSRGRRFIVTDAIFSMDGDGAPLREICRLAKAYHAYTIIDEAHGTGVLGKYGRGLSEQLGLEGKIDIIIGTLSKALGTIGGFVTGSKAFISYLRSKSRPFIFTTALPPGVCAASIVALRLISRQPGLRKRLWKNTSYVKGYLRQMGFDMRGSETPIIPIMIGDAQRTLRTSQYLWRQGLFVPAIRPPTVPAGQSRLRITITAMHRRKDLDRLLSALKEIRIRK